MTRWIHLAIEKTLYMKTFDMYIHSEIGKSIYIS
jgi:hypothetical protein